MSDQFVPDWNPRDPDVLADQRSAYDAMREQCPVAYSDAMQWSVFLHADVMAVLADPETFTNSSRHHAIPNAMNGTEHATHRAMLARFFTDARMAAIEPTCREIARTAVQAAVAAGSSDAVTGLAEPIAIRTMCAFLGWPDATWTRVRDWIHGNREATFRQDRTASHRLAAEYAAMVTDVLDQHRQEGITGDIMADLMATTLDGHHWTDDDIVDTLRNWIAGHGTVAAAIGITIAAIAEDAALQRRLRDQPSLIDVAIDEIPRSDGPLVANSRTTSRPVTIGGCAIGEGERVSLMWIAADRDPRAFAQPDAIDLDRSQEGNLLYGTGIHLCLGRSLARLEMQAAIEELLAGTEEFALAPGTTLRRETYPGNGFIAVPIELRGGGA
ncbi:MAG: cytochrome P450 [Thermomicrobiales bacterium]